ncbi:VOC family protein [Thermomonas brevis]
MKRLHLHISVPAIEQAVAFYTALFDAPPSVLKDDYAKWMLDDPCVNLAISSRARAVGVDHVGVQVDSRDELAQLAARLKAAGETTFEPRGDHLLLCAVGQVVDHRHGGGALGNLLHAR